MPRYKAIDPRAQLIFLFGKASANRRRSSKSTAFHDVPVDRGDEHNEAASTCQTWNNAGLEPNRSRYKMPPPLGIFGGIFCEPNFSSDRWFAHPFVFHTLCNPSNQPTAQQQPIAIGHRRYGTNVLAPGTFYRVQKEETQSYPSEHLDIGCTCSQCFAIPYHTFVPPSYKENHLF